MSHTIYAGNVSKRKNSTLQPSLSTSFDVLLKTPTSLHTPTFTISASSFNYNYLKWGDRYYFVTDVVSKNNNLWEVSAVVDVLATYKTEILASTQYVCYSSHNSSIWLPDTRIPVLKSTKAAKATSLTGILSSIGCYILTVIGKDSCDTFMIQNESTLSAILSEIQNWENDGIMQAFSELQAPSSSYTRAPYRIPASANLDDCFKTLCETLVETFSSLGDMFTDAQQCLSDAMNAVGAASIDTGFIGNAYQNAPQCIRSCIWIPFDYALAPPSASGHGHIYLGTYDTGQLGVAISSKPVTGSNTVSIPWHYNDWRRSTCEDVYLYLPLVGMMQLSGDSLTHVSSLTIDWSVTYTDGVISYKVSAGNEVIGAYGGQCAANYPLGLAQQASAGEIFQTFMAGIDKAVSTAVNSSISPVSIGATVAGSAIEGLMAGYQVENAKNSTHPTCAGGVGGGAGIGLGRDCVCFTVAHDTVIEPSDMATTMGLPTMKPMTLSSLSGYCQCANAHVAAAAESQELDQIDMYLNSGFYIE